jgi:hypothetical protein
VITLLAMILRWWNRLRNVTAFPLSIDAKSPSSIGDATQMTGMYKPILVPSISSYINRKQGWDNDHILAHVRNNHHRDYSNCELSQLVGCIVEECESLKAKSKKGVDFALWQLDEEGNLYRNIVGICAKEPGTVVNLPRPIEWCHRTLSAKTDEPLTEDIKPNKPKQYPAELRERYDIIRKEKIEKFSMQYDQLLDRKYSKLEVRDHCLTGIIYRYSRFNRNISERFL